MIKKLTVMDYVYSLLFIFLLVCIVGAFFYGVEVGKDRSETKYEKLLTANDPDDQMESYEQQHLVSFYHTVFLPYREFQRQWFDTINDIELGKNTRSGESLMKEIGEISEQKYEEIKQVALPSEAKLLVDAQVKLLQSLKLFSSAEKQTDLTGSGAELLDNIQTSSYYKEAQSFGLEGIQAYYSSIRMWNETLELLEEKKYLDHEVLKISEWEELNLNLKNEYIASWLMNEQFFNEFYVQDLVLRIDELILSGQAEKLDLEDISSIAETLIDTRAVRYGDFITSKSKYYEDEILPQLPFFFAQL